jgi:hypothetical protein
MEGRVKDAVVVFGGMRDLLCARDVLTIQTQKERNLEVIDVEARELLTILPIL